MINDPIEPPKLSPWQVLILFLSVFVLGSLLADRLFTLPEQVVRLLDTVDIGVCVVFMADFFVQLKRANRKWDYLKWGWIDLLSSIPALPFLRIGRLARLIRIIRVLRGIRSTRVIIMHLFENRARGTFTSVAMITFVLIVFASIAVLNVETAPDSTIKTAEDAFWWSLATVTTVGYGDCYPRTTAGHVIAAILMISGVALFSTFTATVASLFVQREYAEDNAKADEILRKIEELNRRLDDRKS